MFTYNRAERYVFNLLKAISIEKPNDLSINNVSKAIGIQVIYWEFSSESVQKKGKRKMFLRIRDSPQEQWQEFTHELCHLFWHVGRQEYLPKLFMDYQENQANYFSYHFCVPTFMLIDIRDPTTHTIMETFNVEQHFAERRLEMYKNKLYTERMIENAL